jgi:predicted outer membrane protein
MAARTNWKLALLCGVLLAACRGADDEATPPGAGTADEVAPANRPEPLSDGAAVDVLMALSATGAGAAATGLEQVSTPEVRRYLSVVRADHQALTRELGIIVDTLDITPEPTPAAERLRAAAPAPVPLPGDSSAPRAGGDAAVLEQQLALHRLFLAALDSAVLPGPRDTLVARYATALRPTVSAHLQRGEQLERLLRDRQAASGPPRPAVATAPVPTPTGEPAEPATGEPADAGRPTVPDTVPGS